MADLSLTFISYVPALRVVTGAPLSSTRVIVKALFSPSSPVSFVAAAPDEDPLGLDEDSLGLDEDSLGLDADSLGLDEDSLVVGVGTAVVLSTGWLLVLQAVTRDRRATGTANATGLIDRP